MPGNIKKIHTTKNNAEYASDGISMNFFSLGDAERRTIIYRQKKGEGWRRLSFFKQKERVGMGYTLVFLTSNTYKKNKRRDRVRTGLVD